MNKYWNLMVFTASDPRYADHIVDLLDPDFLFIKNVCYRHQCDGQGPLLVKDLRSFVSSWLKLEQILMVDNRLGSFSYQIFNGIPILPYLGDPADTEMKGLASVCKRLSRHDVDIQAYLKERYQYKHTLKS